MFGIEALDRDLDGADSGTILVRNEVGTEVEAFLGRAAHHWLSGGDHVVYASTERPAASIQNHLKKQGAPLGRLQVLDMHGPHYGMVDETAAARVASTDLAAVASAVAAARPEGRCLLVFDTLDTLIARHGEKTFAKAWPPLLEAMQGYTMAVVRHTDLEHGSESFLRDLDHVVRLLTVQERITSHQYFQVERVAGQSVDVPNRRLYRVKPDGDVALYIPKILVTGPGGAGKTTFISTLSERSVSTQVGETTVAMDRGRFEVEGMVVELFGTPGQKRFDPLLKTLADQAVGVLLMVDASKPDSFGRAAEMLKAVWRQGMTAVVAANKQDLDGALGPGEVQRAIDGIGGDLPVIPCEAQDAASSQAAVHALIERILFQEVKA